MATDLLVQRWVWEDVFLNSSKDIFKESLVIFSRILRRAYEPQACFACEKVESVAKTTAFVSPAAWTCKQHAIISEGRCLVCTGSLRPVQSMSQDVVTL